MQHQPYQQQRAAPPLMRSNSQPTVLSSSSSSSTSSSSAAAAAAAAAHASSDPSAIRVGHKEFTILEPIGKGGSSCVYRVLGPDRKIYALKSVDLSAADEETIESYVNEINLLQMLQVGKLGKILRNNIR